MVRKYFNQYNLIKFDILFFQSMRNALKMFRNLNCSDPNLFTPTADDGTIVPQLEGSENVSRGRKEKKNRKKKKNNRKRNRKDRKMKEDNKNNQKMLQY